MSQSRLNQPLSQKTVALTLLSVLGCVILIFGGRAAWHWYDGKPKSPEQVRKLVMKYLRKKSDVSEFKVALDFNIRDQQVAMSNNLVTARSDSSQSRSNATHLSRTIKDQRREISRLESQVRDASRQVDRLDKDLSRALEQVARLETVTADQPDGDNQSKLDRARDSWAGLTNQLADARVALQSRQTQLASLAERYEENTKSYRGQKDRADKAYKKIRKLEKEARNLYSKARDQRSAMRKEIQAQAEEATSYEQVYEIIGSTLHTAQEAFDQESQDGTLAGLSLANTAADLSDKFAMNEWLTARICEGFILGNITEISPDNRWGSRYRDYYFKRSDSAFRNASEYEVAVRNAQSWLEMTEEEGSRDIVRYRLAGLLEDVGRFEDSLVQLKQIQHPKLASRVKSRIAMLEQRVQE